MENDGFVSQMEPWMDAVYGNVDADRLLEEMRPRHEARAEALRAFYEVAKQDGAVRGSVLFHAFPYLKQLQTVCAALRAIM